MNVESEIKKLLTNIVDLRAKVAWLRKNRKALESVPVEGGFCGEMLDFDKLTHPEVIKTVRALGGKWKKSAGTAEGKIDYETNVDGRPVRCWNGSPPPSCRLVEVEEVIPAQPARVVKKFKMVCSPELSAEIAIAQEKANSHEHPTS